MNKLEISLSDKKMDPIGLSTKNDIEDDLGIQGIESIKYADIYYFDIGISKQQLEELAKKAFTDPLFQKFGVDEETIKDYDFFIEVKLHDDVTDNLGMVSMEAAEDYFGKKFAGKIRTAKKYYFSGKIPKENAERIAKEMLANEVIEEFIVGEKSD